MHKKPIIILLLLSIFLFSAAPAHGEITESDVQSAVNTQGKETVAGNLLIWFLCATAFLKISQRMDSFLNILGVNVGHTGGGAFGDAMIVMKSLGGMLRLAGASGSSKQHTSQSSPVGSGGFTGGLAGMISRQAVSQTAAQATGETTGGMLAGIGSKLYDNSLGKSNGFAQDVISHIATTDGGMMTGDKAADAFQAYAGSHQSASDTTATIGTTLQQTASANSSTDTATLDSASQETEAILTTSEQAISPDGMMAASQPLIQSAEELEVPEVSAADIFGFHPFPSADYPTVNDLTNETFSDGLAVGEDIPSTNFADIASESSLANSSAISSESDGIAVAEGSTWSEATSNIPIVNALDHSMTAETSADSSSTDTATSFAAQSAITDGSSATANMAAASVAAPSPHAVTIPITPQYRDIELGRGQIRGVEVSPQHPEGVGFAMYHTKKYFRPEDGPYVTVQTADGASWYKQYAQPVVKRTPVAETNNKVTQKEHIIYKLPKAPQQKTKV